MELALIAEVQLIFCKGNKNKTFIHAHKERKIANHYEKNCYFTCRSSLRHAYVRTVVGETDMVQRAKPMVGKGKHTKYVRHTAYGLLANLPLWLHCR